MQYELTIFILLCQLVEKNLLELINVGETCCTTEPETCLINKRVSETRFRAIPRTYYILSWKTFLINL